MASPFLFEEWGVPTLPPVPPDIPQLPPDVPSGGVSPRPIPPPPGIITPAGVRAGVQSLSDLGIELGIIAAAPIVVDDVSAARLKRERAARRARIELRKKQAKRGLSRLGRAVRRTGRIGGVLAFPVSIGLFVFEAFRASGLLDRVSETVFPQAAAKKKRRRLEKQIEEKLRRRGGVTDRSDRGTFAEIRRLEKVEKGPVEKLIKKAPPIGVSETVQEVFERARGAAVVKRAQKRATPAGQPGRKKTAAKPKAPPRKGLSPFQKKLIGIAVSQIPNLLIQEIGSRRVARAIRSRPVPTISNIPVDRLQASPLIIGRTEANPMALTRSQLAQCRAQCRKRRKKARTRCREGYVREYPRSQKIQTWRIVDCRTRKVIKEVR